ncbi:MAG: SRPBCC family protein [Archangium sp.]
MSGLLRLNRVLPASPAEVFEACSDAALLSEWLACVSSTGSQVTNDFRVGGWYRIELRAGDDEVRVTTGEYLEIIPSRRIVMTWRAPHVGVEGSVVRIELAASSPASTLLTLTHDLEPSGVAGARHDLGWRTALERLEHSLEKR